MKKQLLLVLSMVAILICLFAISASAVTPNNEGEVYVAADGTPLALYDTDGKALAWFYDSATGEYVSFRVGIDFTMALNSGRELLPTTVISDTDGDDSTTFPYTVSNMILLNGRDYAAFTYISGKWSGSPIQAIYVNNTFRWINKESFNGNNTLRVFDIPKDHTGSLHIGAAFIRANALESFYIPKGATFEGTSTFEYSTGIKSVEFHKEWTGTLKGYEFNGCTALETAILADTVTSIPTKLFYNCYSLKSVNIPNGVTTISSEAFRNCSSLSDITIPENVTLVDGYAFAGAGLVTITFESKGALKKFGNAVFEKCTSLTKLEIPEGVTYLGNCFAKGCSSLTTLSLPSTLETLYDNGHFNGTSLTSITGLENTKLTSIPYASFQGAIDSNIGTLKIPATCTYIARYAFADSNVETVILSPALVQMDTEAFVNCPGLKYVYVPGGLTTIANNTFANNKTGNICFFVTSTDSTYLETVQSKFSCADIVTYETYNSNTSAYKNGRHLISGYNFCDAFYDGVHTADEEKSNACVVVCTNCGKTTVEHVVTENMETVVAYSNYSKPGTKTTKCLNEGCILYVTPAVEALDPLFTTQGASMPENGNGALAIGYMVNREAMSTFTTLTGKTVAYGVFAVSYENLKGKNVFENGVAISGAITADLTSYGFASFDLKVTGFGNTNSDLPLAMGAYVVVSDENTTEYSYMQNDEHGTLENGYYFVTYNQVVENTSTEE